MLTQVQVGEIPQCFVVKYKYMLRVIDMCEINEPISYDMMAPTIIH